MGRETPFRRDPYEADSDREYTSLEADRADADRIEAEAQRYAIVDMGDFESTSDEDVESMAPGRAEDRERLEELDHALDESIARDPEALAAAEARRHALEEDELQPSLDELMERTPLTVEDLDVEELD